MRIFVTGATGFIGGALTRALVARGDRVVALSRGARDPAPGLERVTGDVGQPGAWQGRVAGCDAVIHLAGEPIAARRWSEARKARIRDSRVLGTRHVVAALAEAPRAARPATLLVANGVDVYPFDDGDTPYGEEARAGDGFLAEVCLAWQAEAETAAAHGVRVVVMRTGLVIGPGGGALARMATPFRLFFGGPVGSGRQWTAWVQLEDVVGAFLYALGEEGLCGPVNLVAPDAVRQKAFAAALGRALHRPSWIPVPGPVLRIAIGELAEYLLRGRRVVPAALERGGFQFRHPDVAEAIAASL